MMQLSAGGPERVGPGFTLQTALAVPTSLYTVNAVPYYYTFSSCSHCSLSLNASVDEDSTQIEGA